MKRFIWVIMIILSSFSLFAESRDSQKHYLFLDLESVGEGIILGGAKIKFDYQYRLYSQNDHSVYLSGGMGMKLFSLYFPLGIVYTLGSTNQLVLGMFFSTNFHNDQNISFFNTPHETNHVISPRIGYRRPTDLFKEETFFHIYFSPNYIMEDKVLLPGLGIGLGVAL